MRYLVGLVCVLALGVIGCGETSGTGGSGGTPGECVAGEPTTCLTVCGSVGEGSCSDDGALPAPEDCTPPAEQCDNGLDDDCDGLIDPGFGTLVGSSAQLDDEANGVRVGTLGDDAWIAWTHGLTSPGASVYGAWLAPDGAAAVAPAALAPSTDTQLVGRPGPGDDQVLVPWIQSERVAGLLFAPDGSTVALESSWAEGGARAPAAAWSGADFGLFWAANGPASDQDDLRFARVGADGATLTRPVDIVPAAGEQFKSGVAATWNGTSFGVVWEETACTPGCLHRLRLGEVSRTGMLLSVVDVVDPEGSGLGVWQFEWTGTEYVLAWERESSDAAYLMLVDALGGLLGWHQLSGRPLDERLGGMHFRQVAEGFEVVWSVSRSWGDVLYAQRLSSTLAAEGPEQVVTWSDERRISGPGLTTSGGSPLVSWTERPPDVNPALGPDLLFVQPMGTCAAPL